MHSSHPPLLRDAKKSETSGVRISASPISSTSNPEQKNYIATLSQASTFLQHPIAVFRCLNSRFAYSEKRLHRSNDTDVEIDCHLRNSLDNCFGYTQIRYKCVETTRVNSYYSTTYQRISTTQRILPVIPVFSAMSNSLAVCTSTRLSIPARLHNLTKCEVLSPSTATMRRTAEAPCSLASKI